MTKKKQTEDMSPEEQLEAVKKYRDALAVKQPGDLEALATIHRKNGRYPSEDTLKKFDRALAQIMGPYVPWHFIPIWATNALYYIIQDDDDPFAKPLSLEDVKVRVRMFILKTKNPWRERSYTTKSRMWMHYPHGHKTTCNGWVKRDVIFVDSEKTWPPRCGYNKPIKSFKYLNKLHQLNQPQVRKAFEDAGFTW